MKFTALAVVILALGIVVGFALAGGPSGGPASAIPQCPGPSSQCPTPTPAPPQLREDQVVIVSDLEDRGIVPCEGGESGYSSLGAVARFSCTTANRELLGVVEIDVADYPSGAVFRLEAALRTDNGPQTFCARLFDLTDGVPVSGSEICQTNPDPSIEWAGRASTELTLGAGPHEYVMQGEGNGGLYVARIIVEWTE